jgi:hypothetical protein
LGSLYTTAALDGQTRAHLTELVCAEATPAHDCCLCLGHNKGWEEAASSFAVSWPARPQRICLIAASRERWLARLRVCCPRHPLHSVAGLVPLAQGKEVRLGNAHAALLEGRGASWAEALAEGAEWRLVGLLKPQGSSA